MTKPNDTFDQASQARRGARAWELAYAQVGSQEQRRIRGYIAGLILLSTALFAGGMAAFLVGGTWPTVAGAGAVLLTGWAITITQKMKYTQEREIERRARSYLLDTFEYCIANRGPGWELVLEAHQQVDRGLSQRLTLDEWRQVIRVALERRPVISGTERDRTEQVSYSLWHHQLLGGITLNALLDMARGAVHATIKLGDGG